MAGNVSVMSRLFAWFADIPPDLPPGEARLHSGAKIGYVAWILIQAIYALIFLQIDQLELAAFYGAAAAFTIIYLRLLIARHGGIAFIIGVTQNLIGISLATVYTGLDTGFFLFGLVALIYATLAEWIPRWLQYLVCVVCAVMFIALFLYGIQVPALDPVPSGWALTFATVNGLSTAGFLLLVAMTYRRFVDQAEAALEAEYEKSEELLHNILPVSIAERLKENPDVIADGHQPVSILFADIVGFTELAGRLAPRELVTLLNKIFSRFDALVDEMDLEKIKTIGDAYLVVAGLPQPREDHASAVARLALAMVKATEDVSRETGEPLNIRIGIHSGPVVAGVIGQKKFAYDIWGDTVNVAARMESHGTPGRIQVSADTAECLGTEFDLEPRGEIEVKGKGGMQAFFLNPPVLHAPVR